MTRSRAGVAVLAVNATALVVVVLAASSAGSQSTVPDQYGAVRVAALALIAALAADVVAVLQGRRMLAVRRDRLRAGPSQLARLHPPSPDAAVPDRAQLVAWPGAARYHRPGCALVEDRTTTPATLVQHDGAGRRPCGMCQP